MELSFILGVVVGIVTVSIYNTYQRLKRIKKLYKAYNDYMSRVGINSHIDEVDGSLYIYNSDTGEFLGQGKNMEELNKYLLEKYPGKLFDIPEEQYQKYTCQK